MHGLSKDQLLEERLVALFRQSKVIGGLYRSLGREGESVAAACFSSSRAEGTG